MRRFFSLMLIIFMLCLLPGCSGARVCALPQTEDARVLAKRPIAPMQAEESLAMARAMCANRVLVTDEAIYTLDFDENFMPVLARYSRQGMLLSDYKPLVRDCVPEWLCRYEGLIYYINTYAGDRIECYDPVSGLCSVLVDKPSSFLSVREGRLYYCNERGYFCTAEADGGGERVILEKSCCYPWFLGEALIYQDENDGERLHLYWPADGTDITLSAQRAYAPVLLGDRLIYSVDGGVRSMGMDGYDPVEYASPDMRGAAELIYEQGLWKMRGLSEEGGISQWQLSVSGGGLEWCQPGLYRWCDYIDAEFRVDAVYFTDGRLRDFELCAADGSRLRYLAGKIVNNG